MATRITRKKVEKEEAVQEVPKQPKVEAKKAGIPEGFVERAKERSRQNLELLSNCGIFSISELASLKKAMVEAYEKLTRTSAPVINVMPETLLAFLKDGTYRTFGETGTTNGDPETRARLDYTSRTYGYESLKDCEKYGTIPVEEVNPNSPLHSIPLHERFQARYGHIQLRLKPEVGQRTTVNLMDSAHQWGLDGTWKNQGFGQLFPVPYRTDTPEDFVGCLMSPPTPSELKNLKDPESSWHDYDKECVRARNFKLLAIMEGKDGHEYIEAHVHGEVTPEDVDSVVYIVLPEGAKEAAEAKGIKVVPASKFSVSFV